MTNLALKIVATLTPNVFHKSIVTNSCVFTPQSPVLSNRRETATAPVNGLGDMPITFVPQVQTAGVALATVADRVAEQPIPSVTVTV